MLNGFRDSTATASQKRRHSSHCGDKNVTAAPDCRFKRVAAAVWGEDKLAEQLAAIGGCEVRTARRWLAGTFPPSTKIVLAIAQSLIE